jgi:hypothetical protein
MGWRPAFEVHLAARAAPPHACAVSSNTHQRAQVEGNYLFLPHEPWVQLRPLFADTWFCDVDVDTAMHRVFERQTAIGVTPERSRVRIATNDRPNGECVRVCRGFVRAPVPRRVRQHLAHLHPSAPAAAPTDPRHVTAWSVVAAELVNASKGVAKVLVPSNTPFNGGSGPVAQQQQWRPGGSGDRTAPM